MFYVSGQISHEQIEAMCRAEGIELKEDAIVVDVGVFDCFFLS